MSDQRKTAPATRATNIDEDADGAVYGIGQHVAFASAMVLALFVGCGGWAATAELSGAVITQGTVVVDEHVKKVQHREGGIVTEIKVRNGDRVTAGQLLVQLDETLLGAELGVVTSQLTELKGRMVRLAAERELSNKLMFPADFMSRPGAENVQAGELRLFRSNLEGRESQKKQLQFRRGELEEEKTGIIAQRDAKSAELELFQKELEAVRQLSHKNLVPMSRVFGLEREVAKLSGEHGNLVAQAARVSGQINEVVLQILNVDLTAKTEAQKEMRGIEARVAELTEREIAARDRLSRTRIVAPQDGVIHELAQHTVGGIISPAETVMLIVPDGEVLSIEIKVPPISIDQVHVGQNVRLKFTAFNQRTSPEVQGRLKFISADVSQDPKTRAEFYSGRVKLTDVTDWKVNGKPILPGMPVEAFITTDKRTALSYLMKPITDQFARAFRER
ncbi:MAG: HlyD family type I secretion periplasmic adaptor subunit [Hyphomicrobiaceae bacterium]